MVPCDMYNAFLFIHFSPSEYMMTVNGEEFPIKADMVEIKRYKKTVHGMSHSNCNLPLWPSG